MSQKVYLIGGVRTAIGRFGGALGNTPVEKLGVAVIGEALRRAKVKPEQVDEVIMGCILQAGQGQNVARQAAVHAGIPVEVPALTLNNLCGSGLKAVNMAASMILSGDADIVVAGGMENMSMAPYLLPKARNGYRMGNGEVLDSMIHDGLTDAFHNYHMGITAENIAEEYGITREMQDQFAVDSQNKCAAAQKAGKFKEEIVPFEIKTRKETIVFDQDEYPRGEITLDTISGMRPAFKADGTVTAASASGINDGAAVILVVSERKVKDLGLTPMAEWKGGASAGVDPSVMGMGPVSSTQKLFAKTGYSIGDMDLIEANEAFAAQSLAVGKLLGWDQSKVNVNGGAIALGHPVGASGCRILVTLLHELKHRGEKTGLATLCVGGGMGVSTVVEMCEN